MQRLWMILVCSLVLVPNLAAMIVPFEAWPLTNAPMFAADIKHSALYRVRLWRVPARGQKRTPLPASSLGFSGWHFDRFFLGSVWGSMHPAAFVGRFDDDTPEALTARADAFFDAVVPSLNARDPKLLQQIVSIDVEIERVNPKDRQRHTVGRYDLARGTFTHTWKGR